MLNSVHLIGYLARDPIQYPSCTKFTLCVRRNNKDESDFLTITTFGVQKNFVDKYLVKGRMVSVEGRIETSSYEKDGQKRYNTDIIGLEVTALDKPPKEGK